MSIENENELHPEHDSETGYDESGFNHVMKSLEAEDVESGADFDPDTAEQYQSEAEAQAKAEAEAKAEQRRHDKAVLTVVEALGMYETGIQVGTRTRFKLSDDEKQETATYLAPAVVKYLPEDFSIHGALFGKYKAEVMGVIGLYMLSKSTIASVKELRAIEREEKAEAEKAKRRERESANQEQREQAAA
jgi:hypothetical protein